MVQHSVGNILELIKKDTKLEFRNMSSLAGAILYIISTNYVCFLAFNKVINTTTWLALFWIITLFAAINLISKSFQNESKKNFLYAYQLVSANQLIVSKLIYNTITLTLLSFIGYFIFSILLGSLVSQIGLFLFVQFLGCIGLSGILTLIAAIAAKTEGSFSLMAILSLPLLLPLLLILLKISKIVADGLAMSIFWKYAVVLIGINILVSALSYILFNYLWRT
ncbi:MAG: heme exporter protein CcmB [Bacteroidetes bacterium]|nr:heme exporter protein CcmB [Bacteroidota bacterium]